MTSAKSNVYERLGKSAIKAHFEVFGGLKATKTSTG
jgi:hypothetical protein